MPEEEDVVSEVEEQKEEEKEEEPEPQITQDALGLLQLKGKFRMLPYLLQCLLEMPFMVEKLQKEELDFWVNQKD